MSLISTNKNTVQNPLNLVTVSGSMGKSVVESKAVGGKKIDEIHHKIILPTHILLRPVAPKTAIKNSHGNPTIITSRTKNSQQENSRDSTLNIEKNTIKPTLNPVLASIPNIGSQRLMEFKLKIANQKLQQDTFNLAFVGNFYQPNFVLVGNIFDTYFDDNFLVNNSLQLKQAINSNQTQEVKTAPDRDYHNEISNFRFIAQNNSGATVDSNLAFEITPEIPLYHPNNVANSDINSNINIEKNTTEQLNVIPTHNRFGSTFIASNISNEILSNPNKQKLNLSELGQEIKHHNIRAKIKNTQKIRKYSFVGTLVAGALLFATLLLGYNNTANYFATNKQRSANANTVIQTPISPAEQKKIDYTNWITKLNNNKYSPASNDDDGDGLTNYEEFLLGTDPFKKNSCTPKATDLENLVNLVNPKTCVPIDFKDDAELKKFSEVINIPQIQKELISDVQTKFQTQSAELKLLPKSFKSTGNSSSTIVSSSQVSSQISSIPALSVASSVISSVVAVSSASNSSSSVPVQAVSSQIVSSASIQSTSSVDSLIMSSSSKPTIISSSSSSFSSQSVVPSSVSVDLQKVNEYVQKYRSYDANDSAVGVPVDPSYFVKISQDYGVPLKYVLAMGRYESRYGTDQHNPDGSLNRIARHKNMFSIGLDDDGGSITYDTWEDGADAFGKWYKKFDDRGIADCTKWRIYNPNGDYCQKIESLANQIDNYLKS